jgi:hypothetical protein
LVTLLLAGVARAEDAEGLEPKVPRIRPSRPRERWRSSPRGGSQLEEAQAQVDASSSRAQRFDL